MAVSPALTYPSAKRYHLVVDTMLRPRLLIQVQKQSLIQRSMIPPAGHMLAPRLIYRSVVVEHTTVDSLRWIAYTITNRRRISITNSLIKMRGFPIPYLSRVTTRPPYGEQWPRFAVFGSTM